MKHTAVPSFPPFLSVLTSLVVTILLIELCGPLLVPLALPQLRKGTLRERMQQEDLRAALNLQSTPDRLEGADWIENDMPHPYLGFVRNSAESPYGFPGMKELPRKETGVYTIGLFGGSVAYHLYDNAKDVLVRYLRSDPRYRDADVRVVLLALGGFKQPQQLLALNYMLALGAHFDTVINLDGFNEVVLPLAENLSFGISPYYPRLWNYYSQKRINESLLPVIGKLADLQEKKAAVKRMVNGTVLRYSYIALLTADLVSNRLNAQGVILNTRLMEQFATQDVSPQTVGPEPQLGKDEALVRAVEIWANSSRQMAANARGNNIRYFHFLQPNQYVPDSKVLTAEELKIAYKSEGVINPEASPYSGYKEAVEKGYPQLRQAGSTLQEQGVSYTDLTELFKPVRESIYIDDCCHYNRKGYELVAEAIARKILAAE